MITATTSTSRCLDVCATTAPPSGATIIPRQPSWDGKAGPNRTETLASRPQTGNVVGKRRCEASTRVGER